ncbi:MAG TPA: hypothetical protein VI423_00755 [Paenisporosarcina sp.]|nr:hypothetical protein [Paenisporosarcina sp.]
MDKSPKKPSKEYFNVKLETIAPVTLNYRVYAETPEQAIEMASKLAGQQQVSAPIISFARLKNIKATAYTAGTSLIRLARNFI